MSETSTPEPHADARRLRALAHPVRVRLILLLREGPAKVSDLAAEIGEPPNSVSFHLRQLEKYAMAERVPGPEGSSRKESWWTGIERQRLLFDPHQWQGDQRVTNLALLREALTAAAHDRIDGLMAAILDEDAVAERPQSGQRVVTARLSNDEAGAFTARLQEIVAELAGLADSEPVAGAEPWTFVVESFPDVRHGR